MTLRFKAICEGVLLSGITLAMVWSTRIHGTRRRRAIKHCLHTFPNICRLFVGVQSVQTDLRQQKTLCATSSFSVCFTNTFGKLCTAPEPQAPTRWGALNNNILIVTKGFNNNNNNSNHFIKGPHRFFPTGDPLGEGFFPPILGGNFQSKESPVLPIPSYPALCRVRTLHPGITGGREHITSRAAQSSPEQLRAAQSSSEQPRAAESSPEQLRAAQSSWEQPRAAESSPEQLRAAQINPEQPRAA